GVELNAVDRELAMADRHHLAVRRSRRDLQRLRDLCGCQRVVPAHLEPVRQPGEEASAVVADGARLAVDEGAGGGDLAAERFDNRLVAEADSEGGSAGREPPDDLEGCSGVCRAAGTGGDDELRRGEPCGPGCVDGVVSTHDHLRAELAEQMREVVRERVVVVDEQDHRCSASARSIAASTAASFRRHSSCSAAGSESATIPAPAWRWATPSLSTIVLIAMHVSSRLSSGSA